MHVLYILDTLVFSSPVFSSEEGRQCVCVFTCVLLICKFHLRGVFMSPESLLPPGGAMAM